MSRPTVHTATRVLRVLMPGKAPKIPVSVRARACAAPVMRRFASTRRAMSSGSGTHTRAGFALDIDGCVWRGGDLIPGSRDAVGHLIDQQFPVVFMTNGGGKTEVEAAQALEKTLDMPISPEQVVLSHSPMRSLVEKHEDEIVLVSGKEKAREVLQHYGFTKVLTCAELHTQYPFLWPDRRPRIMSEREFWEMEDAGLMVTPTNPIGAVFGVMDADSWARDAQLMTDVLRSAGCPNEPAESMAPGNDLTQRIPLYMSCPDLEYMAEAALPRYGAGCFGLALAYLFEQSVGSPLQCTWFGKPEQGTYDYALKLLREQADSLGCGELGAVYAVGDNPVADIRGANNAGDPWQSVLVRTGVFTGDGNDQVDPAHHVMDDLAAAVGELAREWYDNAR